SAPPRPSRGANAPAPLPGSTEETGAATFESATSQMTESALLARAQELLARDPGGALDLVSEHERRFALGLLMQEREVIAINALLRLDRRSEADSRARRFHAQYPQSAYGRRIDVLLKNDTH